MAFAEKPRFSLFHRDGPRMRTLLNGEKIPIIVDINAFAGQLVAEEIKKEEMERTQRQQPAAERRKPLIKIRNMVAGLAEGVIK